MTLLFTDQFDIQISYSINSCDLKHIELDKEIEQLQNKSTVLDHYFILSKPREI